MGSLTKEDRAMSNTIDKATCADLIAGELKDREQQLEQLYTLADDGDDDAREQIYEMAYGVTRREIVEITLSDGELMAVNYIYQDWYDGARLAVDEDSPAYRYALEILEMMAQ